VIASTGHSLTHAPQSMQASETFAFPFSIVIASTGQELTQASQPVQVPELTFAGMFFPYYYFLMFRAFSLIWKCYYSFFAKNFKLSFPCKSGERNHSMC
jgi:hypothetical protein